MAHSILGTSETWPLIHRKCQKFDHALVIHGRDLLTGEIYVECACGQDREYEEGTGKTDGY